jgi:sec-independent protein translocase protein TatC
LIKKNKNIGKMPLDQPSLGEENESGEKEMSFLEHLEELRWHILRSGAAMLVFTILAMTFSNFIFHNVIMGPSRPDFWTFRMMCKLSAFTGYKDLCVDKLDFSLQSIEMSGQFMNFMLYSFIIGLVFTFPYLFWEVWRFVSPGLKIAEKKAARGAVFFVSMLFFSGVLFGYFVVSPLAINFLANFTIDESIENQFTLDSYISLLATLTLACGLTFQMPVIVFVLSKIGIVTPKFMKDYRKHAFIIILIIAGVVTPSPDMISQILVMIPLVILYELSIGVSARVQKAKLADELETDGFEKD